MEINNRAVDKTGKTAAESQGSDKSTGFENVKNTIADKLHNVAEALNEKAADPDAQCGIAQYGKAGIRGGWTNQPSTFGNSTMSRLMPGCENTSGRARDAASW